MPAFQCKLDYQTAGESHGPGLSAILEGIPAGLALDLDAVDHELARRQKGFGAGGRMKIERDQVRISGGLMGGHTTGGPLALAVENRDWKNWREKDVEPLTRPRPGHADLTGAVKYGYRELRLSLLRTPRQARSSASNTTLTHPYSHPAHPNPQPSHPKPPRTPNPLAPQPSSHPSPPLTPTLLAPRPLSHAWQPPRPASCARVPRVWMASRPSGPS